MAVWVAWFAALSVGPGRVVVASWADRCDKKEARPSRDGPPSGVVKLQWDLALGEGWRSSNMRCTSRSI